MDQIVTRTAPRSLMANAIRVLAMDAVEAAKSGHPGLPMGMADVVAVLFERFVAVDPTMPDWPDRDRVIHSAGHGSMLVYSLLHLLGYEDMTLEELRNFRQLGSRTAGHPEYGHAAGIETTTGPLGQGLANAVGMALAERMENARFGDELVDHFTYAICGDGCLMEGISHEAIDMAGHLGLGRLVVLWDDNRITIDGATSLSTSTDQVARFAASGWHAASVDGHDADSVAAAIAAARDDPRPSLIACRTIIGFGAPTKAGTHGVHGAPLGAEEIAAARAAMGWHWPPFEVPEEARAPWREAARRGTEARNAWEARLAASQHRAAFEAGRAAPDAATLRTAIADHKRVLGAEKPSIATRVASQKALEVVNATLPNTVGGSADLTGSNNTRTGGMQPVTRENYAGRYIHYGIREHAMAAAMNGIALHGGFVPYGGTFLCFSDYSRPAIRLSALMGARVVHVMTHDSIGLGEDGPTHQPVEHLAALRAIPGLLTIRPCDAIETAEAWEVALTRDGPSVLVLTRQNLPTLRTGDGGNLVAGGAYVLAEADGPRDVTLIGTGSEVAIAVEAAALLAAAGVRAAVVSAPCLELFAEADPATRRGVLGDAPRVAVEAAVAFGWERWIGERGAFVGMTGFGASAPAPALYRHFGITPEAVAAAAKSLI